MHQRWCTKTRTSASLRISAHFIGRPPQGCGDLGARGGVGNDSSRGTAGVRSPESQAEVQVEVGRRGQPSSMIDAFWAIYTSSREGGEEREQKNHNYEHSRLEIHLTVNHLRGLLRHENDHTEINNMICMVSHDPVPAVPPPSVGAVDLRPGPIWTTQRAVISFNKHDVHS